MKKGLKKGNYLLIKQTTLEDLNRFTDLVKQEVGLNAKTFSKQIVKYHQNGPEQKKYRVAYVDSDFVFMKPVEAVSSNAFQMQVCFPDSYESLNSLIDKESVLVSFNSEEKKKTGLLQKVETGDFILTTFKPKSPPK